MAQVKYCKHCRRKVLAVYIPMQLHPLQVVLILLTGGLFLPIALLMTRGSRYVCPKCTEDV